MSDFEENQMLQGTISKAGKASADLFGIFKQINKLKQNNSLRDLFIQNSHFDNYLLKEKEQKNNFENIESNKTPKNMIKSKINLKKYFKDFLRNQNNNNILLMKKNPKNSNNKNEKKDSSLNLSVQPNKNKKLLNSTSIKFESEKEKINKKLLSPFYNKIKYKFHNIHINKLKEMNKNKETKNEIIYKPKLSYIYNKSNITLDWKIIPGRKKKLFEDSGNSLDKLYSNQINSFNMTRNSLINMNKQTKRSSILFSNDIRQRHVSKFIPINFSKTTYFKNIKNKNISPSSTLSPKNDSEKKTKIKNLKNISNLKLYKSITPSIKKKYRHISDFKRTLGRFSKNRHDNRRIKSSIEGVYYPNYNYIKERTKNMVLYHPVNKGNDGIKKFKNNKFKGITSNDIFNASDAFNKIEVHKSSMTPKFEKMISRPSDKNLPFFMQKIFNRFGADIITDKSLKLNNFSNSKTYYDIYKTNLTTPKYQQKKKEDEIISLNKEDYSNIFEHEEEIKVNETEEEKNTNKLKIELNKIVYETNKLYNNYMNSKF